MNLRRRQLELVVPVLLMPRILLGGFVLLGLAGCGADRPRPAGGATEPALELALEAMVRVESAAADPQIAELMRERRLRLERLLSRPQTHAQDQAWAFGAWAMVMHAHAQLGLAREAYSRAEGLDPGDPRWPYLLAHVERTAGRYDASSAAFERVLALRPQDLPARLWRARNALDVQELERARAELESLNGDYPHEGMVLLVLAHVDLEQKRYGDAAVRLERVLEVQGEVTEAIYALATAYRGGGNAARSATVLKRLPEDDSASRPIAFDDPWMQEVAALRQGARHHALRGADALRSGHLELALNELGKALAADPDRADVRHGLATALVRSGRRTEARRHLAENLRRNTRHVPSRVLLARLELAAQDRVAAETHLVAALEIDPSSAAVHAFLGELRLRQGRPLDALAAYQHALALAPQREDAHAGRVRALGDAGRNAEAKSRLEESLEALPDSRLLRDLADGRPPQLP